MALDFVKPVAPALPAPADFLDDLLMVMDQMNRELDASAMPSQLSAFFIPKQQTPSGTTVIRR